MEIEAVAAPEGSVCAKHPERAGVFVCTRCGDYGCAHCLALRRGDAMCQGCKDAPQSLPAELGARLEFLYVSSDGRIDRRTWWLFFYLPVLAYHAGVALLPLLFDASSGRSFALSLVGLLLLLPGLAMCVKRLHDRNLSGWWLLMAFVPLVGAIWYVVALGFLKGDIGSNRYGPPTTWNWHVRSS